MLDFFVMPKSYIKNVYALDIAKLVQDGFQLLLCDIDNTLVAFHETVPSQEAQTFLEQCKQAGLQVVICSNNTKERVGTFAEAGNVEYISFFCKPFPWNYIKLRRMTGIAAKHTACVGDQILTDILGGNWMGLHTVFCDPLHPVDSDHTKFSRFFERYILRWLSWRKRWKKGEYYGYQMQGMRD